MNVGSPQFDSVDIFLMRPSVARPLQKWQY
jgi:hypothetical protein